MLDLDMLIGKDDRLTTPATVGMALQIAMGVAVPIADTSVIVTGRLCGPLRTCLRRSPR